MATLSTPKVAVLAPDRTRLSGHYGCMASEAQKHYLKEWRKYRGFTQESLGTAIGRTKSAVQKVETFQRDLGSDWASMVAPVLKIDVADLFSPPPGVLPKAASLIDGPADMDEVERIHNESRRLLEDTGADDKAYWALARHILEVRRKYRKR